MASKKLKRVGKAAAAIGAAYLASQALSKKKPTSAEAKGLKITRAKKFRESDEGQMARLDASVKKGLDITRSKPFAMSDEASPATYENVPGTKFLSTPGGFSIGEKGSGTTTSPVDESDYMSQNEGFGPMAKDGKFIKNKIIKAEEGKMIDNDRLTDKDRESAADIVGSFAPYIGSGKPFTSPKDKIRNRLSNKKSFGKGVYKSGGFVISRGNKLARSKPTKLF